MKMNNIKKLRAKKGLTQAALARAVGVSQQQIHRFESGITTVRLEMAICIAAALEAKVDSVFPRLTKALESLQREIQVSRRPPSDEQYERFRKLGIEADPQDWTVKFLLRGHENAFAFPISIGDKNRLHSLLFQGHEFEENFFFVFESDHYEVAVCIAEIAYCQFLFDYGSVKAEEDHDWVVSLYFRSSGIEQVFETEPDPTPRDEEDMGQLASIFYYLDSTPEAHHFVNFVDVDGEEVFLQAKNLALLTVPLNCLYPEPFEPD